MKRNPVTLNGNVIVTLNNLIKRLLTNNPGINLSTLEVMCLCEFEQAAYIANQDNIMIDAIIQCLHEDGVCVDFEYDLGSSGEIRIRL